MGKKKKKKKKDEEVLTTSDELIRDMENKDDPVAEAEKLVENPKSSDKSSKSKKKKKELIETYEDRISTLEGIIVKNQDYINHLERLSEAYDNLEALAHQELLDADRMIKAQEIIQELMNRERIDADKTIRAQESVVELSTKEKQEAERLIKAQEQILELARKENKNREQTIEAHEKMEQLAQQELVGAQETIKAHEQLQEYRMREKLDDERTIKAHEQLIQLSILEKQEAEKIIQAQEEISNLSMRELKEKDNALRNILVVNKNISSILEEESLLDKILRSLSVTLHAERGILFIRKDKELIPSNFINIDQSDMEKHAFDYPQSVIDEVNHTQTSKLIINEKVKMGRSYERVSIICAPLIYQERLLGVIYLDIVNEEHTFKHLDLDVAEIFSSQAAISINNSYLYEKILTQNGELLRLVNLKNRFISHVSEELANPVITLFRKISKLSEELPENTDDTIKVMKYLRTQAHKVENTVLKVLAITSLEQEVEDLFVDKINFKDVIAAVLEKHKGEIENKGVTITANLSEDFEHYPGNETIIRTIFDEMISNAVFYNRDNGMVEIKGYKRDDYLVIEIVDNGYGIKKKDINHIFNQFYRTDDSPKLNEWGAGLGLYMVKMFIEHYKGSVEVESRWRQGSKFTLTFLEHD